MEREITLPNGLIINNTLEDFCAYELDASTLLWSKLNKLGHKTREDVVDFYHSWDKEAFAKRFGRRLADEFDTKMKKVVAQECATLPEEKYKLRWEMGVRDVWLGFEDGAIFASVVLCKDNSWGLYLYHTDEYKFDYDSAEEARAEADRRYAEREAGFDAWLKDEGEIIDLAFIEGMFEETTETIADLFGDLEDDEE
jgi:hypothetical protein